MGGDVGRYKHARENGDTAPAFLVRHLSVAVSPSEKEPPGPFLLEEPDAIEKDVVIARCLEGCR
jgi:hypothetical protein